MPDPTLQATALRFAANDLPPEEAATFGARLATDEAAQDALAEAVRLSAKALGQAPPEPRRSFRAAVCERLGVRRSHRRPAAWAALGAVAVAVLVWGGATPAPQSDEVPVVADAPPLHSEVAIAPEPRDTHFPAADDDHRTTAEIWAELSTPDHVEKAHDDELKRRQRMRDIRPSASMIDARDP